MQNRWPGKRVLESPEWIERVICSESKVFVDLDRALVRQAPADTHDTPVTREFKAQLHQHYQRRG